MGLQRFPIGNFTGGVNLRDNPFELNNNEAQILLNVSLSTRGSMGRRKGITRFDTSGHPVGVGSIADNLKAWYPNNGGKYLFCSIDGDIYITDQSGAMSLKLNDNPSRIWCFESMEDVAGNDRLWAICGQVTSTPRKFDNALTISNWTATLGSVPNGSMLKVWKQRMIVAGVSGKPMHLYWSDPNNPESWPANNFLIVSGSEDDIDPITWIDTIGDTLLIFKRKSVWAIHDPVTFSVRRLGGQGCYGRFQSAVIKGKCYFFNAKGIWSTQGINVDQESELIDPIFQESNFFAAIAGAVRVCAGANNHLYVCWGDYSLQVGPSPISVNITSLELIPDLRARQRPQGRPVITAGPWLFHHFSENPRAITNFEIADGSTAVVGGVGGKLVTLNTNNNNDNGAVIPVSWLSGWKSIIAEEPFERVRRVTFEMDGSLKSQMEKDGVLDAAHLTTLISPVGVTTQRYRPETRARYHALYITDNGGAAFNIYRAELSIRGGKEH